MESIKTNDYKESYLPPIEQEELNALRRVQFEREFNEEEGKSFFELSKKEEQNRSGVSEEEKVEYLQLTREQTEGRIWTPEKGKRVVELQNKM